MPALSAFDPNRDPTPSREVAIVTSRDLFVVYLERTEAAQTPKVFAERKRLLGLFLVWRGNTPILDLIPDDLEEWIERQESWKADWMRLRVSSTIKRPYNWAVRKGLLKFNPFMSVSYPTGARGKPIDLNSFRSMLRSTTAVFRRVLLFMSWTGTRPGELSTLEWSHIDIANGQAVLHLHKTSRSRKDREPRIIYLPDVAVRLLCWIKRHQGAGIRHVFLNSKAKPWNKGSLDLRIWRLRENLGIDRGVKLYGCRHAWATKLAMNGVGLVELAALLGHTSIAMAQYYIHIAGQNGHMRTTLERGLKKKL
jgi:integrase